MADFDRKKEGKAFSQSLKSRAMKEVGRNLNKIIPEVPADVKKRWDKKLKTALKNKNTNFSSAFMKSDSIKRIVKRIREKF
jgi:hypothetical protein